MEDLDYNSDIDIYSDPDDLVIPSDPEEEQPIKNKLLNNGAYNPPNQLSIQPGTYNYDEDFEESDEKFESEEVDFPLPLSTKETYRGNGITQQTSINSIGYKVTDSTRPQSKTSKTDAEELFITETEDKQQSGYDEQAFDTPGTTTGIITKPSQDELKGVIEYVPTINQDQFAVIQTSQNLVRDNRSNISLSINSLKSNPQVFSQIQRRSNSPKQQIEIISEPQKTRQLTNKSSTGLLKSPSRQIQILQELQNENTDLRRDLKKLSDQLNDILESNSNLHTEIRKRPPSSPATKNRLKGEQLKTAEKQLETYKLEKERLKRRTEKIQNVDYVSDLKKTIQEKEQLVTKLEKLIKLQDVKHRKAGKDLERYYDEDERPEEVKKISDITAEIGRYKEKCAEIETELDRMQEVYDNQYEMESNLTEKHEKLLEIASHYNTPINPQNKGVKEQDRIKDTIEKLKKQIGVKQRSYDTTMSKLKQKEQVLKQQFVSNGKTKSYIQEQIFKINAEVQVSLIEVEKSMKECESVGLGKLIQHVRGRSQGNDSSFLTQDNSLMRLDDAKKERFPKLESASLSEIITIKDVKPPKVSNPFGMNLRGFNYEKELDAQPLLIPAPILPISQIEPLKESSVVRPKFDFKMSMNSSSKPDLQIKEENTAYLDKNPNIVPFDSKPKIQLVKQDAVVLTALKSEVHQPDLDGQLYTPSIPVIPIHTPSFNARSSSNKNSLAGINESSKPLSQILSKDIKETNELHKVNTLDYLYDIKSKEKPQGSVIAAIPTIPTVSRRDRSHLFGAEDSKSPPQSLSPKPQSTFLEDIKRVQQIPKEEPKLDSQSSRVTRDRSHLFKQDSNPKLPKPEEPLKTFGINPINKIPDPFDISRNKPIFETKLPEPMSNSSSRKPLFDPKMPSGNDLGMNKPLFENKRADTFDASKNKLLFDNKIPDTFKNLSKNSNNTEVLITKFNNTNPKVPSSFSNNSQPSLFDPKPDIKDSIRRDRSHLLSKEDSKPIWQQPTLETKPTPIISSNRRKDTIPNSYSLAEKAEKTHFLMDLEESSSPQFDPNEFKSQLIPTKPSEIASKAQMSDFSPQPVSSKTFGQPKPALKPASKIYNESLDLEEEIII